MHWWFHKVDAPTGKMTTRFISFEVIATKGAAIKPPEYFLKITI